MTADTKQPDLSATTTLGPATGHRNSTGEAAPLEATAVVGDATGHRGTPADAVWDLAVAWRRFEALWGVVLTRHRANPPDPMRVAAALDDLAIEIMGTAEKLRAEAGVEARP